MVVLARAFTDADELRQTAVIQPSARLLSLALLVAACASDATKSAGGSTSVFGATTTAVTDVTTTADTSTTTPPATSTTVAPTTTLPEGGFGEPVPAEDSPTAWVAGAQEGDPEVAAAPGECAPFYDAVAGGPYTVQECGIWNAIGGQRMWTITKGASGRFFAIVWQQNAPNNWVPRLRALEDAEGVWSDFTILTGNIDSGPNDELVSGARIAGTGDYLDLSVVDIRAGNPRVMAVYNGITKGNAVLRASGGVEFWMGIYADSDPNCCPSSFQRYTIFATDLGDWLVVPGPTVAAGDPSIPASDF